MFSLPFGGMLPAVLPPFCADRFVLFPPPQEEGTKVSPLLVRNRDASPLARRFSDAPLTSIGLHDLAEFA
jgi:hypothetical protein